MIKLFRLVQPEKADPIVVKSNVAFVILVHPKNAWFPMLVVLFGIVMAVSLEQL